MVPNCEPGNYYVNGSFSVNNEPYLLRTIPFATASRDAAFMTAVRDRDGQCLVSGLQEPHWMGLQAGHLFPLGYGKYWDDNGFGHWMTESSSGSINSVQNGLLLRSDVHQSFDLFSCSINPDDGYKIVYFLDNFGGFSGKCLDQHYFTKPDHLSEHLLRWHYRLLKMRSFHN